MGNAEDDSLVKIEYRFQTKVRMKPPFDNVDGYTVIGLSENTIVMAGEIRPDLMPEDVSIPPGVKLDVLLLVSLDLDIMWVLGAARRTKDITLIKRVPSALVGRVIHAKAMLQKPGYPFVVHVCEVDGVVVNVNAVDSCRTVRKSGFN